MDIFKTKLTEFAQYYGSDINNVFRSENYLVDEKCYKQLLVSVLGNILRRSNIKSGQFILQIIDLIENNLNYEKIIGTNDFIFYKKLSFTPRRSFSNLLGGYFSFVLLENLKSTLKHGNKKEIIKLFETLLYSHKNKLSERINTFQDGLLELYRIEFDAGRLEKARQSPRVPLNLLSILLTCAHPNSLYFYKPTEYRNVARVLGFDFEKKKDTGSTYERALSFANKIKAKLQKEVRGYKIDNIDAQSFIYVTANIIGGKPKPKIAMREILRGLTDDFADETLNEIEKEQDRLSEKSLEEIRVEAENYRPSHDTRNSAYHKVKVRQESIEQKEKIRKLENYQCQVCGLTIKYTDTKGKERHYIQVDHIINWADGGREEICNLWALCPNCHAKKTLGVIKIDPKLKKVEENGKEIKIKDNHLDWYK